MQPVVLLLSGFPAGPLRRGAGVRALFLHQAPLAVSASRPEEIGFPFPGARMKIGSAAEIPIKEEMSFSLERGKRVFGDRGETDLHLQ